VSRNRAVSLLLVALFLWVTACTSYKRIEITEVADHGKVRVTRTDGVRQTVHHPRLDFDSIRGQVNTGVEHADWVTSVIPADQVLELEAVETNTVGTVLLIVGSLAVVFVLVAAACSEDRCGSGT